MVVKNLIKISDKRVLSLLKIIAFTPYRGIFPKRTNMMQKSLVALNCVRDSILNICYLDLRRILDINYFKNKIKRNKLKRTNLIIVVVVLEISFVFIFDCQIGAYTLPYKPFSIKAILCFRQFL